MIVLEKQNVLIKNCSYAIPFTFTAECVLLTCHLLCIWQTKSFGINGHFSLPQKPHKTKWTFSHFQMVQSGFKKKTKSKDGLV